MQVSIIFPIVNLVFLFLAIVWKLVDWRELAIKWVGNNPEHAQVYVNLGGTVRTYQGERIFIGADADIYAFKSDARDWYQVVFLPRSGLDEKKNRINIEYPYDYIVGRRIIGLKDGQLVASPLGFMEKMDIVKYHEGVSEISAAVRGNEMVKAMKSVKTTRAKNWMKYLLIAIIAVGLFFVYQHFKAGQIPAAAPGNTANVTQVQPVQGQQIQPGVNIIP